MEVPSSAATTTAPVPPALDLKGLDKAVPNIGWVIAASHESRQQEEPLHIQFLRFLVTVPIGVPLDQIKQAQAEAFQLLAAGHGVCSHCHELRQLDSSDLSPDDFICASCYEEEAEESKRANAMLSIPPCPHRDSPRSVTSCHAYDASDLMADETIDDHAQYYAS